MFNRLPYKLTSLAFTCLLAGCTVSADCPVPNAAAGETIDIHIVRHRWHTGIILPADRLPSELEFIERDLPEAAYYEFGWGDARFYRDPRERISIALRALLWPTDSVMHVVALPSSPEWHPHTDLHTVPVSQEAAQRLGRQLTTHFTRDDNTPEPIGDGLYGHSLFYAAAGTFWLGYNCNHWTVSILSEAGLPTGRAPRLTAGSVMRMARSMTEGCE